MQLSSILKVVNDLVAHPLKAYVYERSTCRCLERTACTPTSFHCPLCKGFVMLVSYLEESSTDESSDALEDNVEECLEDSNLSSENQTERDGWIDMAAGNVTDALSDGRDCHTECESDANNVGGFTSHARTAANLEMSFKILVVVQGLIS